MQPHGLQSPRLLCWWDFPGKSTGVGCHFLLQGIFPTQGLNTGLLHCRRTLYPLSHEGSPPLLGTCKTREEGSGGRGWRSALPRRKPRRRREAGAGWGAREPGLRPRPAQGSVARGLQVGAWEEDWLGQEAARHVPLGPPRGGEAAAARGVPARRSLRPPRRGGSSGRTTHSGSVVRAAHRSLSGPFSPSFAGGAGDPDARRM